MIEGKQVLVGDEPTLLHGSTGSESDLAGVKNEGDASVWLGGPDVAVDEGYELGAGGYQSVDLENGDDDLYAIRETAAGDQRVDVLATGVGN